LSNAVSELFLVRHAQASLGNADYDKLSELGHRQAEWLGEYFAARNIQFDQVVTGGMTRHRETAAGIVRGMQWLAGEIDEHAAWNEFDFRMLTELYMSQHPGTQLGPDAALRDMTRVLKNSLLAWAHPVEWTRTPGPGRELRRIDIRSVAAHPRPARSFDGSAEPADL
jgi:hypothetical protein